MTNGVERVVYVQESLLEIRELNSWVYVDGQYRGSGVHIESIQDQHGQQFEPVLESVWSEVTDGVVSRRQEVLSQNYSHELRVDALYLPVRILFRSWFQLLTPEGGDEQISESRFWVRYMRG